MLIVSPQLSLSPNLQVLLGARPVLSIDQSPCLLIRLLSYLVSMFHLTLAFSSILILDVLTAYVSVFTKPGSRWRLLTTICALMLTYVGHKSIIRSSDNGVWKAAVSVLMWMHIMMRLDDLCLTRISWEEHQAYLQQKGARTKSRSLSAECSNWEKFKWGLSMTWNMRGVHTKWAVKEISKQSHNLSRSAFLKRHLIIFIVIYLLQDLMLQQPSPEPYMFSPEKKHLLSRLQDVTFEELIIRISSSVGLALNAGTICQYFYSGMALVLVGLGIQDPDEWPPLFGFFWEAYTLRNVWG